MNSRAFFGSYHASITPLHALDARVKIICLLVATIALFAVSSPLALLGFICASIILALLAGITLKQMLGALKPTAIILLFSLLANAFVVDGTADIVIAGSFGVTFVGALRGACAVGRIFALVVFSLILSATTSSTEIADAFTSVLAPLGIFGLPVGDIAMTISVALRFIPLTAEEFLRIRDAQRARGVRFDEGGLITRLKLWLSVLTPLVVALFRRSDDLAQAMRERCYQGRGRTRFTKKLKARDTAILIVFCLACIGACLI